MSTETIEQDNEHFRVTRVEIPPGDHHKPTSRGSRYIINLTDSHIKRHHAGAANEHKKAANTVTYHSGSDEPHSIENLSSETHVSLVIEPK